VTVPTEPALVLASGSPRRLALLQQLGLQPSVQVPDVDERARPDESPQDQLLRLARAKADAVAISRRAPAVVLGADTLVLHQGRALGKPRDRDDFLESFAELCGSVHTVSTAVAVRTEDRCACLVVSSQVRLCAVTREQAIAYWASGEPADKAGGYAIQGRGGRFVESLNGSYSNVVGLPLFETARLLVDAGVELDRAAVLPAPTVAT